MHDLILNPPIDANKFGAAYLSKLGWASGTGLGTNGEGRTSHIKVFQKLDMLGIGAAHQKDPNGIAWKQNKDFESLLKRLNAGGEGDSGAEPSTKVDGFAKASAVEVEEDTGAMEVTEAGDEEVSEKKKRKRSKEEDVDESGKRSKKEKGERKKKKEKKEKVEDSSPPSTESPPAKAEPVASTSQTPVVGPP